MTDEHLSGVLDLALSRAARAERERDELAVKLKAAEYREFCELMDGANLEIAVMRATEELKRRRHQRDVATNETTLLHDALCKVAMLAPGSRTIENAEKIANTALEALRALKVTP